VQNAVPVRVGEAPGEPHADLQGAPPGHGLRDLGQRLAPDELGDDVGTHAELPHPVDGHDVGVLEARRRTGLDEQPLARGAAWRKPGDELHRDLAVERLVVCQEDLTHPPGANVADKHVLVELGRRRPVPPGSRVRNPSLLVGRGHGAM
jgi:hypothetical protein